METLLIGGLCWSLLPVIISGCLGLRLWGLTLLLGWLWFIISICLWGTRKNPKEGHPQFNSSSNNYSSYGKGGYSSNVSPSNNESISDKQQIEQAKLKAELEYYRSKNNGKKS